MAEDWVADVRKYAPDADDAIIAGIVRYCGIALSKRDSALVAFSDARETARVRDNFLKKKLGLTQSDAVLDKAIAAVGLRMKADRTRNRVTVYYLLAEKYGKLALFARAPAKSAAPAKAAKAAKPAKAPKTAKAPAPVAAAPPVATAAPGAPAPAQRLADAPAPAKADASGDAPMGWLLWLLLALLALFVLWWLFFRQPGDPAAGEAAAVTTEAAASAAAIASAPAQGSVTIPAGAGVTSEQRGGKPVVKVYFDTGKVALDPTFADAAAGLKDHLAANPGTSLAVSGYNDTSGNAAANAELSRNRAQAVAAGLVAAGIAQASVTLAKPEQTTDTAVSPDAARRVEVVVK